MEGSTFINLIGVALEVKPAIYLNQTQPVYIRNCMCDPN